MSIESVEDAGLGLRQARRNMRLAKSLLAISVLVVAILSFYSVQWTGIAFVFTVMQALNLLHIHSKKQSAAMLYMSELQSDMMGFEGK